MEDFQSKHPGTGTWRDRQVPSSVVGLSTPTFLSSFPWSPQATAEKLNYSDGVVMVCNLNPTPPAHSRHCLSLPPSGCSGNSRHLSVAIGGLITVLIQACSLPTEGSSVGVNGISIVGVGSVFAGAPACSPSTSWLI